MNLGNMIKDYRTKNNISMEELAKRSGLSKGYISMLENNKNPRSNKPIIPSIETIKRISKAINMDINNIISNLDENQKICLDDKNIDCKDTLSMNNYEDKLLDKFNKLNEIGMQEAIKRVEELTYINKYTNYLNNATNNDNEKTEEKTETIQLVAYGGNGVETRDYTKEELENIKEAIKNTKFRTK